MHPHDPNILPGLCDASFFHDLSPPHPDAPPVRCDLPACWACATPTAQRPAIDRVRLGDHSWKQLRMDI